MCRNQCKFVSNPRWNIWYELQNRATHISIYVKWLPRKTSQLFHVTDKHENDFNRVSWIFALNKLSLIIIEWILLSNHLVQMYRINVERNSKPLIGKFNHFHLKVILSESQFWKNRCTKLFLCRIIMCESTIWFNNTSIENWRRVLVDWLECHVRE